MLQNVRERYTHGMMNVKILATARSFCSNPGEHQDLLRRAGCELILRPPSHPYSAAELAALLVETGAEGAVLGLDHCDESVFSAAKALRVVSRYGVGLDSVDVDAATRHGVVVTSTPGTNSVAVAELAIGLMFALARNLPNLASSARAGTFKRGTGWELTGKTLGLVGYGVIGREVAKRAVGLGMQVLAYDPFFTGDSGQTVMADLSRVLSEAHIVSLHAPLSAATANVINAETIAMMRDGAVLINTARGGLVDEQALYAALTRGRLAGAAMDAFAHEPPEESPLLALENFIATPHVGASTLESVARTGVLAAQNCLAVLQGEACPYIVNPAALEHRKPE